MRKERRGASVFRFIPRMLMMAVTESRSIFFFFFSSQSFTVFHPYLLLSPYSYHHDTSPSHSPTISFHWDDGSLPLIWRFSSNSSSCWSCFSSNSAFFLAFFFIFFFLLFDMLVVLGDCSSLGAVLTRKFKKKEKASSALEVANAWNQTNDEISVASQPRQQASVAVLKNKRNQGSGGRRRRKRGTAQMNHLTTSFAMQSTRSARPTLVGDGQE